MTFVPPATSVAPELYLESDEDVRLYEDVSGSFRGFWRYYGSEKIFALVDLDDGRKVHVWTYYFRRFGREIFKIKEGERISLHKTSYDPRGAYTSWKVKSVPLRYFLNPAGLYEKRGTTWWIHFAVRPSGNRRKILFDMR